MALSEEVALLSAGCEEGKVTVVVVMAGGAALIDVFEDFRGVLVVEVLRLGCKVPAVADEKGEEDRFVAGLMRFASY